VFSSLRGNGFTIDQAVGRYRQVENVVDPEEETPRALRARR
jgi:hypothetical protein